MLDSLLSLAAPALLDRLLLALNHVVGAEPAALQRLRPHAGRRLAVQWQLPTGPWPRPPDLQLLVTPAGLFERAEPAADAAPADLRVEVELPAPPQLLAHWLAGTRPRVAVDGDAALAADVAWLAEHLRWDAEQDLAGLVGAAPAHELTRLGRQVLGGLRGAADGLARAWGQRPGAGGAAPR